MTKLPDDDLKRSKHVGVVLSVLKCFKWKLYRCIFWLIVEVILRNARCNDEIHKTNGLQHTILFSLHTNLSKYFPRHLVLTPSLSSPLSTPFLSPITLLLSHPISVFSRSFHVTLALNNLSMFHFVSQVQKAMEKHLQSLSLVLVAALLMALAVPACRISEFPCRNGRCIRLDRYCDEVDDCGDKSDEPRYCTGKYTDLSKLRRKRGISQRIKRCKQEQWRA